MRRRIALFLALGLLVPQAAVAQVFYRSTMPDGKVVLSDRPMPGARKIEEVRVSPGNVVPGGGGGNAAPPAPSVSREAGGQRSSALGEAEAALKQAQEAYDAANDAAQRGKEALEGERSGTAGGMSRLNDNYWARQKQLEDNLSAAQRQLDAARARYNSAR